MNKSMLDMSIEEINKVMTEHNMPKFRGKQIYSWLMKGADFDEMNNLPKDLRSKLSENYVTGHAKIHEKLVSQIDGTIKYLFKLHDGVLVEGVLMKYDYGNTLCMSTQAGCLMGCVFCSSALDGKTRDLSDGDMLAQVIATIKDLGGERPINNIVLMGSGEPFDNYDNTVKFLERVHDRDYLGFGYRSISLSTCGLVKQLKKFCDENIPVTMCISLHAGNDETRKKIMPIANLYTIRETLAAAKKYFDTTGRRIIIEYTLINGINDDEKNARDLAKALKGMNCNVNIIRLNEGAGNLTPSTKETTKRFIKILTDNKINATLRRSLGSDIFGACGQLRHKVINKL